MEIHSVNHDQITENFIKTEADITVPELAFVIPSFNHSIDRQMAEISLLFAGSQYSVIAIDDGSSRVILDANESNVTVIMHESNLGLAQSLVDGYKKALETRSGIIIRADADGEYPMSAVIKAVDILQDNKNAGVFVEHRRTLESNGLIDSAFHNIMGKVEGNALLGFPMSQHSPGLQVYRREVVEAMLPILKNYVSKTNLKWGLDLIAIKLASKYGDIIPITLESHVWKERRPLKKILFQMASATKILIADKTGKFSSK